LKDLGWIGVWLLVVGAIAIVAEFALAGLWTFRLSRKAQVLSRRLAEDRLLIQADLERLRVRLADTEALWQPYRRLLRFLQHPLVIALLQSYARRRARTR
jgi:hypothetical protein